MEDKAILGGKLPIKPYGGNPMELAEFMGEYFGLAKAYGYDDDLMILRLPIYLTGVVRAAYIRLDRGIKKIG